MFRASSAHLQEDTVVCMQHMILSLSMRVRVGLSVHTLIVATIKVPTLVHLFGNEWGLWDPSLLYNI